MGNVTECQNSNAPGLTEKFSYDNLYRLVSSTLQVGTYMPTTNLQMCYDNTGGSCAANQPGPGNITSRSDVAGGTAWTYDTTHIHAVTQAGTGAGNYSYTYDANGNAITRNGLSYGWTSYNYPSSVLTSSESASFDYGPDRSRWRMSYTGSAGLETTYYASPLFEKVIAGGVTDYRHYIYAGNKPVALISRTSAGAINVRSLLFDHQGSVASIVADSSGTALVNESFTAYGNRREASNWSGAPTSGELTTMNGVTRQGYTFQTVLGSMGLNHMNGRIQDAITGRFLSPDPVVQDLSTQSFNRYSYVNNNPLTFSDPTGFDIACGPADICVTAPYDPGGGYYQGSSGGQGSPYGGGGSSAGSTNGSNGAPSSPVKPKSPAQSQDPAQGQTSAQTPTSLTDAQLAVVAANANGGGTFTNTIPGTSASGANSITVIVTVNSAGYVSDYSFYDSQTGASDPNSGGASMNPIYNLGEFLATNPSIAGTNWVNPYTPKP